MARRLASVRRIWAIEPISKSMALAKIDGWTCVVKKDGFAVGDLVLYFEIDSFLPSADPRFAALGGFTTFQGSKGVHVKSVMYGKKISQGLILQLALFPEVGDIINKIVKEEGEPKAMERVLEMSFEDLLKVSKWELPAADAARSLGAPPVFFPKTDIERIQNCPNLFTAKYKNAVFQESTKMDGASMTVYYVRKGSPWHKSLPPLPEGADNKAEMAGGRVGVCSRKHDLSETTAEGEGSSSEWWWRVALRHRLPAKLAGVGRNLAVQGELCGPGIGGNREGLGEHDFFVYRIWDVDAQEYLPPRVVERRARELGLRHVPVHGYVRLHEIAKGREDILGRAEGLGINGRPREGLVFKNCADGRCFKAISNAYLVQNGE
ncbi:RNA ligase, DRB0094 family [Xylariaceae sp. FL0804]|nr:RNA ligase, DRB0094 family [Xylariaceae sp. FL0804]